MPETNDDTPILNWSWVASREGIFMTRSLQKDVPVKLLDCHLLSATIYSPLQHKIKMCSCIQDESSELSLFQEVR